MYILKAEITDYRCIGTLTWEIDGKSAPGWHVILGTNGTGKSSILRAMALPFLSVARAALSSDLKNAPRNGTKAFEIKTLLLAQQPWENARTPHILVSATLSGNSVMRCDSEGNFPSTLDDLQSEGKFSGDVFVESAFLAYGPFRKFNGAGPDLEKMVSSDQASDQVKTLFHDNVSLMSGLDWLKNLRFEQLEAKESDSESEKKKTKVIESDIDLVRFVKGIDELDDVIQFVNQPDFLPNKVKLLEVSSKGVFFSDAMGSRVTVEDLSDGFRSVLSMVFDILRQLGRIYKGKDIYGTKGKKIWVEAPAVVLIDEVDAHLHPSWQKQIGETLTTLFPKIQFIVTTHSPFVCQSAVNSSIFMLEQKGKKGVTGHMLDDVERDRLLYGDILDAYELDVFLGGNTRSKKGNVKQDELAELNTKKAYGIKMTTDEEATLKHLTQVFVTNPTIGKTL